MLLLQSVIRKVYTRFEKLKHHAMLFYQLLAVAYSQSARVFADSAFTPRNNVIFHRLSLAGADQHDVPIGWPTFNLFGVNAA